MRTIIIAAGGKGTRWNKHLGVKKHEVKIDGQQISQRTKEQFEHLGDEDINLLLKGKSQYGDLDKIWSSRHLWNKADRTIIVFGDTYFTDAAIEKISEYKHPGFVVFGRIEPSEITGKPYGELYAVSFFENDFDRIQQAIERVVKLQERGAIETANLWALYRAMHKFPDDLMNQHFAGEGVITINDETEDFDWPVDYDRWMKLRRSNNKKGVS